jgi:hypothetical protein
MANAVSTSFVFIKVLQLKDPQQLSLVGVLLYYQYPLFLLCIIGAGVCRLAGLWYVF